MTAIMSMTALVTALRDRCRLPGETLQQFTEQVRRLTTTDRLWFQEELRREAKHFFAGRRLCAVS